MGNDGKEKSGNDMKGWERTGQENRQDGQLRKGECRRENRREGKGWDRAERELLLASPDPRELCRREGN